jgi:hypothetical protein
MESALERIFERHGLPEAIRSDNGAPFASVQALHGLSRFLTGSLAGWEIGLQRTEKGQLEIWFGRLLLGHLDPQEVDFLRSQEAS